jgi:hypothetical protein
MFTEKTVRTMNDAVDKRFEEGEKGIRGTRSLLLAVLILNIIIMIGVFLVWSSDPEPVETAVPMVVDTTSGVAAQDSI